MADVIVTPRQPSRLVRGELFLGCADMRALSGQEVAAVLRLIGAGALPVAMIDPPAGDAPGNWCGDMTVRAAGYSIVLFFDVGDLDYVDVATAPDGRMVTFEEMLAAQADPVDLLTGPEVVALLDRLASAVRGA